MGWRNRRVVPVMFLGGALDHTTRLVPGSAVEPGRPASPTYVGPDLVDPTVEPEPASHGPRPPHKIYKLHKVVIETKRPWWVYVLEGHAPPRQHVLNTCPHDL